MKKLLILHIFILGILMLPQSLHASNARYVTQVWDVAGEEDIQLVRTESDEVSNIISTANYSSNTSSSGSEASPVAEDSVGSPPIILFMNQFASSVYSVLNSSMSFFSKSTFTSGDVLVTTVNAPSDAPK